MDSEHTRATRLFMKVWGIGPSMAEKLAYRGLRTLDDLREHSDLLNPSQVSRVTCSQVVLMS